MPRKRKQVSRLHRWLKRLGVVALLLIAVSFALILPLRWLDPPTSAFMLRDASGREPLLHEWVAWQSLGTAAPLAVVAAEDQKFADHFGLDLQSIAHSIDDAKQGAGLRGASTISQQVSKNLFLWPGRSLLRKGIEAYLTLILELSLPKYRILEIYLNVAELGPGIYGFGAASQHYFGKPPAQLTDSEAALLAAVLPNPIKLRAANPSAYVRERQRWILSQVSRLRRENWIVRIAPPDDGA